MLDACDINFVSFRDVFICTTKAFVFPLIGMLFYNICLLCSDVNVNNLEDIQHIKIIGLFTVNDFSILNTGFWLISYYYIFFYLYVKRCVNLWAAIASLAFPYLLLKLTGYVFKNLL
jgi:hypothetical protein